MTPEELFENLKLPSERTCANCLNIFHFIGGSASTCEVSNMMKGCLSATNSNWHLTEAKDLWEWDQKK